MGPLAPSLSHLRQTLATLDPAFAPRFTEAAPPIELVASLDAMLGGGLARDALHELAPATPIDLGAATGFAAALAARAARRRKEVLWVATDFAVMESGGPYGPGLDLYGLPSERLLVLRVSHPVDVLWAMEEALRCRALSAVIAELPGKGAEADLTATRRLTLAARDGATLGLLLRQRASPAPVAAATRWRIAAAPSLPDKYGGLGVTRFELSLLKNRRGPSGRWIIEWCHHECAFRAAVSVGVAEAIVDGPDRAPQIHAGRARAG